jgi:bis(5'-nucleosidyl)-tetraphosphatase
MIHDTSYGIIPLRQTSQTWEVLLVQLHAGHWGFPKGHAEEGETPEMSAERELKEETGLKLVKFLSETTLSENYFFTHAGSKIKKSVHYFLAEVQGRVKIQELEIAAIKWVPLSEAEAHITFKEGKSICQKVIQIMRQKERETP